MTTDELVSRINELAAKSRGAGLDAAELEEQKMLRQEYVARFRESLRATLDNTVIIEPDGTRKVLRKQ